MKKILSGILAVAAGLTALTATAQEQKKSFEEFRKGILSDFSSFRKTILDHYADFLNGEWHEYESLNGEKRDRTPKPKDVPSITPAAPKPKQPAVDKKVTPDVPQSQQPVVETEKPRIKPSSRPRTDEEVEEFLFYGLPMQLPRIDYDIHYRLASPTDYASQWKDLNKARVAEKLLPHVKKLVKSTGLNDYLTYKLIESYIDSKFPQADASSRMSAVHFLLANLGYDARIAMTGSGVPLLLLPFKQTIYARNYMMTPEGKYYVFTPEGYDFSKMQGERIRTCALPADAAKGEKFDLVLGELKVPLKPKKFEYSYGPVHIEGEVNENLMPILYRYPQMPIGDYARSNVDPQLRKSIVSQVKSQIGNLAGDEGVSELLKFMHNVFEYSTDEDFHGFEKPYFVEETLYYPKNDCEDRAIFYTYLLWNALGREAQLVSFPGHEAATVRLENPVEGTSYQYEGDTFYISDPTFIGSSTGMVMPMYKTSAPNIDYTYK